MQDTRNNAPVSQSVEYVESARQNNIPEAEVKIIGDIADKFGVKVQWADTLGDNTNGTYKDGVITIARDTPDPVRAVFTHELTHHIESSGQYKALSDFVYDYFRSGDMDVSAAEGYVKDIYAKRGVTLDDAGVRREMVAK